MTVNFDEVREPGLYRFAEPAPTLFDPNDYHPGYHEVTRSGNVTTSVTRSFDRQGKMLWERAGVKAGEGEWKYTWSPQSAEEVAAKWLTSETS